MLTDDVYVIEKRQRKEEGKLWDYARVWNNFTYLQDFRKMFSFKPCWSRKTPFQWNIWWSSCPACNQSLIAVLRPSNTSYAPDGTLCLWNVDGSLSDLDSLFQKLRNCFNLKRSIIPIYHSYSVVLDLFLFHICFSNTRFAQFLINTAFSKQQNCTAILR